MSLTPRITVLIGYEGAAEPPGFTADMECLGGKILAVQFGDVFAEAEALDADSVPGLLEGIERRTAGLRAEREALDVRRRALDAEALAFENSNLISAVSIEAAQADFARRSSFISNRPG